MFHRRPFYHNLLFALRPSPILARQIAAMAQRLGPGSQPWDKIHVTLFILAGLTVVDPALVAALRRIGESVAAAPFDLSFDRMIGTDGYVALRPSRRSAGLVALVDQLTVLARAVGLASDRLRISPHISLIYRGGRSVNERVGSVGWLADELVLIDSHVGASLHEERGRWPLAGGPPDPQLSLL